MNTKRRIFIVILILLTLGMFSQTMINSGLACYSKNISIVSISTIGSIQKGENITVSIVVYNDNNKNLNNVKLKYPNFYETDLIFERNYTIFSIPKDTFLEITVHLYINVTEGDFELLFVIEESGDIICYDIYHLLVDGWDYTAPGIYNTTIYNQIYVNISIFNFVNNIINNNISIYQDLFNEIFNYFNTTIYNNLNYTIYNTLYNDIYNEINNTFYAEVQALITNNIENINNINNTILTSLYNFIENEVNVTLTGVFELKYENGLDINHIIKIIILAICLGTGIEGILIGTPIISKNKERNPEELKDKKKRKNIFHIKEQKLNYKFKVGIGLISIPIIQSLFALVLFNIIKPFSGDSSIVLAEIYGVLWAAFIFTCIMGIDNSKGKIVSWCIFIGIVLSSSFLIGICMIIVTILFLIILFLNHQGINLNLRKKNTVETFYKI